MSNHLFWNFRRSRRLAVVVFALFAIACGGGKKNVIPSNSQPDRYLMDRANEAVGKKEWLKAREYFRQVVDNYPGSPLRPDAKLGIGDTFLNEGGTENYVLGANEFREFLTFYPTNPRADYAQFKLGMAHFRQMRLPQRDQTETRAALREFDTFIARYPGSSLMAEAKARQRETRDRLSEADYQVGYFYYRQRWYPGAIDRFKQVLKDDPGFTGRDSVYFYLAESLVKVKKEAEALPYLEKLVQEFEKSEHLVLAQKLITDLKAQVLKPAT